MRRVVSGLIVAGLVFGVAACGDDDDGAGSPAVSAETDSTGEAASFNDADVGFAQGMIAHHQQALEMAALALDPARGASDGVLDLATRIQMAQGPEIELMSGWLDAWDMPMEAEGGHDMEGMSAGEMPGMMSAADMAGLGAAQGAAFDAMCLEMMIAHHQGAIETAQGVQDDGSAPEVADLAQQIITAQQGEIEEMNALLER